MIMALNSEVKIVTSIPESHSHVKDEEAYITKDQELNISQDVPMVAANTSKEVPTDANLVRTFHPHYWARLITSQITWSSPTDPRNPKNWPQTSKWLVTSIVSLFLFVTIMCSTIISPALPAIGHDLNIENDAELEITMSIYVLGYAFGPLFLAPLSELYGRVIVLQLSNVYFVVWSVVCGFANSKSQMIVARFMTGIGSSAALGVS